MQPSEMTSPHVHPRLAQRHYRWLSRTCGLFCIVAVLLIVPQVSAQQRSRDGIPASGSASRIDPKLAQRIAQQSRPEAQQSRPEKDLPTRSAGNSRYSSDTATASFDEFSRTSSFEDRTHLPASESSESAVVAEPAPAVRRAAYQTPPATSYADGSRPEPLRPTPPAEFVPEPEFQATAPVARARHSAAEKSPGVFLDLTGERPLADSADSTRQPGERGAEVSIETSPTQVLMRAVAWIVIALCLFSLAALGVRRWQRERGLLPTSNSRSRVLETLSLGPGRTVSLIEMAGYRALVASDAGGIKQLVIASASFHDAFSEMERDLSDGEVSSQRYQPPSPAAPFSVITE